MADSFRSLLERRFSGQSPRRLVRGTTRALGWIARRLPHSRPLRSTADRLLSPAIAWSIRSFPRLFDFVPPSDESYWRRVDGRLPPFWRAVYAWLGVEGAVMRYGVNFRLPVLDEQRCVERLYQRDESGAESGGCPWGLRNPGDGFACRTIMMGSRHVFGRLEHAQMKVDIGIPEMTAIERIVTEHLERGDVDEIARAVEPEILAVFSRSMPEEADFLVDGKLRPETAEIVRELIADLAAGKRPAIFCQFRIVP
jgi:hypothetical protein